MYNNKNINIYMYIYVCIIIIIIILIIPDMRGSMRPLLESDVVFSQSTHVRSFFFSIASWGKCFSTCGMRNVSQIIWWFLFGKFGKFSVPVGFLDAY